MARGSAGRRGLQALVGVIGLVAVVAGTATLLLGARSIAGAGDATPSLDSELRFYAAWYVAAGVLLLRSWTRVETATVLIRVLGAAFFVAGAARALSWATVGRPHTVAIVLMAIEFALPLALVPWQAAVARRARDG